MVRCDRQRRQSADRLPHEHHRPDAQSLDDKHDVIHALAMGHVDREPFTVPMTARVQRKHAGPSCQPRRCLAPFPRMASKAVQQEHSLTGAAEIAHRQPYTVTNDVPSALAGYLRPHHVETSTTCSGVIPRH